MINSNSQLIKRFSKNDSKSGKGDVYSDSIILLDIQLLGICKIKYRNLEKEALELKAKQYDLIQEQKKKLEEKPKEIKKKPKVVVEDDNDDNENSSDSSSEEEVVQKKKSKPKKITDIDDVNIHHIAYKTSQDHLIKKIMSDRILNNLTNYHNIVGMKYY